MQDNGKAENQHYVPKMLLKNFCLSESNTVYAYDKWERRVFKTNILNASCERDFYVGMDSGDSINAEPFLSFIEGSAGEVLKRLLANEDLGALSVKDKVVVSFFIATQHVRTKHTRETFRHLNASLAEHIRKMGFDPQNVDGFAELDDTKAKAFSIGFMQSIPDFAEIIHSKEWLLLSAPENQTFYISDNPITLHNDKEIGAYGNIGFAVNGIQIYCPLSSSLTLALYCPSVLDEGHKSYQEHVRFINQQKALSLLGATPEIRLKANAYVDSANEVIKNNPKLKRSLVFFENASKGSPARLNSETMEFQNYLQVRYAHRFVYSSKQDFALVERILSDHPDWKIGLMPRTN